MSHTYDYNKNFIPLVKMPQRYAQYDAYVSASHGTGFSLATAEAMSMELPVVAVNWSGRTAFVNEENSYLVPVDEFEVISRIQPNVTWAVINTTALGSAMRQVFNERDGRAREIARCGRQTIVEKFSLPAFQSRLVELLQNAEETLPRYDPALVIETPTQSNTMFSYNGNNQYNSFSSVFDRPTRIKINP